jgi:LysM repeat protein
MKKIQWLLFFFIFSTHSFAQKITIEAYINTYKDIAMKEMVRSGVPASITLAQGILETENGNSALVKKSNNHFGIKCKETWTGPSVSHDDDAPQECFRKYEDAIASYIDHSDFLRTRKHYHFLFDLDPLDYKAWAYGLKKAGYATNPKYPMILIKYIETYNLHDYSLLAMGKLPEQKFNPAIKELQSTVAEAKPAETIPVKEAEIIVAINPVKPKEVLPTKESALKVEMKEKSLDKLNAAIKENEITLGSKNIIEPKLPQPEVINKPVTTVVKNETPQPLQQTSAYPAGEFKINETRVVFAEKGTSLLSLASSYNLSVKYIYDFNDFSSDVESLPQGQLIYLQRKRRTGAQEHHIVQEGEALYDIAQKQGIRMEALLTLNHLTKDYKPAAGQKLYLQNEAPSMPVTALAMIAVGDHVAGIDSNNEESYEVHIVQPKQTLYALSKQYSVSIQDLMNWNNLAGPEIKEGMELIVSQKDYNVYKSTR